MFNALTQPEIKVSDEAGFHFRQLIIKMSDEEAAAFLRNTVEMNGGSTIVIHQLSKLYPDGSIRDEHAMSFQAS